MTRARLIEKVIAEFLVADGWIISDETGMAEYVIEAIDEADDDETIYVEVPAPSEAIDAEFDRIAREAATR